MSRVLAFALLLCTACTPMPRTEPAPRTPSFAFTHVNVVDVEHGRVIPEQTVLIAGNRIRAVGPSGRMRIPSGAQVVDATGKYLIPGLWDMHVHAGSANGFRSHIENRLALLVAHGVTGLRNHHSTAPLEDWVQIRGEINSGERVGPRLILSGPMLDGPTPLRPGAMAVSTPEEVRAAVDRLLRGGADYINVSPTLPRDAYLALAEEANRRGVAIVGPVPVAVSIVEASELGHGSVEHLSPIPESCSPRSDEFRAASREIFRARARGEDVSERVARRDSLQDLMLQTYSDSLCRELFQRFAANGTWIVPTLLVERTTALAFDAGPGEDSNLRYVPASERRQWETLHSTAVQSRGGKERARTQATFRQRIRTVAAMHRAGVGLLAGTDIPGPFLVPGLSLHEEMELLIATGLSPLEVLRTATLNPARYLEATDSLGTVEVGKLADLVLLDANPLEDITNTQRISAVVLGGRYLDRKRLDELLAEAERAANAPQS